MPLPLPPGYVPKRQKQIDWRRVVLAGLLFLLMSSVLVVLAHNLARTPGEPLPDWPVRYRLLVIGVAGFCGAWNEAMAQIAFTRRGSPGAPLWRFRR